MIDKLLYIYLFTYTLYTYLFIKLHYWLFPLLLLTPHSPNFSSPIFMRHPLILRATGFFFFSSVRIIQTEVASFHYSPSGYPPPKSSLVFGRRVPEITGTKFQSLLLTQLTSSPKRGETSRNDVHKT